jgi:tetratricopeptide (TPR) repeat protein
MFKKILNLLDFRKLHRGKTIDLLQKSIFAPLTPQLWGEPISKSPRIGGFRGHPKIQARSLISKTKSALLANLYQGEWNGRETRPATLTRTGKPKVLRYKPQITKTLFVLLFITSFFFVQGEAWLFGVGHSSVVAQTPAEVTNTQQAVNPDALVEEAKKLYQAQKFPEAITLLQQAAEAFAARKDVLKQAMTLDLQGQINLAQAKPETAVENFSDAAALYERSRKKTDAIESQINQAQALRKAGFYRRALDLLDELKKNLPNEIDPQLKAIALRSLGITQRLVGDLSKAETSINESLKFANSNDSPKRQENISAAYLMLGNIAKDRGNAAKQRNDTAESAKQFQFAINYYKQAAAFATTPTAKIEAQLNALSVFGDRGIEFGD